MRSEFDEVFKDAYDYWIDDADIHRYEGAAGLADQIWHHQQAKVDELQKRVDASLLILSSKKKMYVDMFIELEQALKGGLTPNLNTDENGECLHFSTTLFNDGEAECFHCDAVVNEKREVIGKQSKGLHPFFKKESK